MLHIAISAYLTSQWSLVAIWRTNSYDLTAKWFGQFYKGAKYLYEGTTYKTMTIYTWTF